MVLFLRSIKSFRYIPENESEQDILGWNTSLSPDEIKERLYTTTSHKTPEANNGYDLPSVEALVLYMHAEAGFPVRSKWLRAIKNGNFNSWPGLTYNNATKYFPHSVETIKGHMVKSYQGVRSTKRTSNKIHNNQIEKSQQQSNTDNILPNQKTK